MAIFLVVVLAAILEVTAVPYASIRAASFNLPVIVLIFFSLKKGFKLGAILGIFFGVFNGLFSTGSIGLNIILYGTTGFMVGYIREWFYKERLLTFILMVFCSMVFICFSRYAYTVVSFQAQLSAVDYTLRLFLPQAAYTTAASIFLYYFLRELKV